MNDGDGMPMLDNVHHLPGRSIQGEQQDRRNAFVLMDQGDVDEYVDSAPDGVLACREKGRHDFAPLKESTSRLIFTESTEDGLLVRREQCRRCKLAECVEFWDVQGRGQNARYSRVAKQTRYLTDAYGTRYLGPPGRGRMTPKQVSEAIVTGMLRDVTPAQLALDVEAHAG